MLSFCEWLASTPYSIALIESLYMYPLIESVHVWTLGIFFGMATVLDLRLLGFALRSVPVSDLLERLQPWTLTSFAIMIVTGSLLFYAIPVRTYQSVWFRAKMLMLVLAGINILIFHKGIYPSVENWRLSAAIPRPARLAGALSLLLWSSIIISGRFIAYNWFDCDRQPQPTVINVLAGCVIDQGGE